MKKQDSSPLVNPEEIEKAKNKLQSKASKVKDIPVVDQNFINQNTDNKVVDFKPAINTGGTVKVMFESGGRFGNPSTLYMNDYKGRHINDLVTTKEEKLLETLVHCMNECVVDPVGFDVSNLTPEEFFELQMGMKVAFDTSSLKYRWFHKCQENVPESDRKMSESTIYLKDLKTTSIEQCDENIRIVAKEILSKFSKEDFDRYLINKYGQVINKTIDQEVESIKVKEPFIIVDANGSYEFSFMRIKYLIEAQRLISKEMDNKIRVENNKPIYNMPKDEITATRQGRLEELSREKVRKFINYSQAMCLVSKTVNGVRTVFSNVEEKINEWNNVSKTVSMGFMKANEAVAYGITHEAELECDLCDETDRGLLRRILTPVHLLPISNVERDVAPRKLSESTGFSFYF